MKFILVVLSLFVLEVSLGQDNVNNVIKPEDYKVKPSCPQNPDMSIVKGMIETFIEANKLGHMQPSFAKKQCLDKELPYRVVVRESKFYDNTPETEPFFIRKHKVKSVRKFTSSSFSDDYIAEVEIKGKDKSGKGVKFKQRALFVIKKGAEAELYGCVDLHGGWERPFISEDCYKK